MARRAPGGRFEAPVLLSAPALLNAWDLQAGVSSGDPFFHALAAKKKELKT